MVLVLKEGEREALFGPGSGREHLLRPDGRVQVDLTDEVGQQAYRAVRSYREKVWQATSQVR